MVWVDRLINHKGLGVFCVCSSVRRDDSHPEPHHGRHHSRSGHWCHDTLLLAV